MCLPPPGITEEERASTAFFRISRITHDLHGGTQTALARGNPVEVRKGVITTVATVARVADSRRTHDLLGKSRVREGATGHPRGWPHGGRTVADGGRRWQTVADGGRRWQTVADGGGGHSALGWRERVGPSRRRPSRRRSGRTRRAESRAGERGPHRPQDPGALGSSLPGPDEEPRARSGPARRLEHRASLLGRCGAAARLRRAASALRVRRAGPRDGRSRLPTV
jgi:hypothetical protein